MENLKIARIFNYIKERRYDDLAHCRVKLLWLALQKWMLHYWIVPRESCNETSSISDLNGEDGEK